MYDGRILQCSQGHSVCEKCHKKIGNECPQCRSHYVGTRNYVLEEMVKQLRQLKQLSSAIELSEATNSNSVEETGDSKSKSDEHPEVKVANVIAKFLASIPKPSSNDDDEDAAGPNSDTTQEEPSGIVQLTGLFDRIGRCIWHSSNFLFK